MQIYKEKILYGIPLLLGRVGVGVTFQKMSFAMNYTKCSHMYIKACLQPPPHADKMVGLGLQCHFLQGIA